MRVARIKKMLKRAKAWQTQRWDYERTRAKGETERGPEIRGNGATGKLSGAVRGATAIPFLKLANRLTFVFFALAPKRGGVDAENRGGIFQSCGVSHNAVDVLALNHFQRQVAAQ
jgi:hypothetical protein